MDTRLSVDVLSPGALRMEERAAWRAMLAASPALRSPFFRLEFAEAADGVAPGAAVAVVHRAGEIVGFLPFQKRHGRVQPLAAPLCDYTGLIAWPGAEPELSEVLKLIGAREFAFTGLVGATRPNRSRAAPAATMRADLSEGAEAWIERCPSARRFFKDKARAWRAAERSLGPLEFSMDDRGPDLLGFVISRKRHQYRRTARHDIFGCGWTELFLQRLLDSRAPDFGARIATLRAGGRVIAAELGLRAGPVQHVWFPTYDPDFAQWGPGALLLTALTRAAGADPALHELDFGREGESFKRFYAEPSDVVYEGRVEPGAWRRSPAMSSPGGLGDTPAFRQVAEVRERMRRRLDVITACETTPASWLGGALDAIVTAGRRGPALAVNG